MSDPATGSSTCRTSRSIGKVRRVAPAGLAQGDLGAGVADGVGAYRLHSGIADEVVAFTLCEWGNNALAQVEDHQRYVALQAELDAS